MLTSLFGELGLSRRSRDEEAWQDTASDPEDSGFAATTLLESIDTAVNEHGQMVDRHVRDLLISGSPADGMRRHFARNGNSDGTSHAITLYDPMKVWAPAVIKALSDASGQPIERLHLREQPTMKTLALIERTRVVRRFDDTLKIYHADVRVLERGTAEIPMVLLERSQLGAVIVGPMHSSAVEHMMQQLVNASRAPTWRCPRLLFMLPPTDVWMADYITGLDWPARLTVSLVHDSLNNTSTVWNALLDAWNRAKAPPPWSRSAAPTDDPSFPIRVAEFDSPDSGSPDDRPLVDTRLALSKLFNTSNVGSAVDTLQADEALRDLLAHNSGVLAGAIVDAHGQLIAQRQQEALDLDLEEAANACLQLQRAQRLSARAMGLNDPIDETILSGGNRQQVLRPLAQHPGLMLFALIDRGETNLALVRYRMREIERVLG